MEADFAVSGRGSYVCVYGHGGASSQGGAAGCCRLPTRCYLLAAVVMPTVIHVYTQIQYFAPSVFSGASIRHK